MGLNTMADTERYSELGTDENVDSFDTNAALRPVTYPAQGKDEPVGESDEAIDARFNAGLYSECDRHQFIKDAR